MRVPQNTFIIDRESLNNKSLLTNRQKSIRFRDTQKIVSLKFSDLHFI